MDKQIFFLLGKVSSTDNASALQWYLMILGFKFKEFFIAMSTPPPLLLNFFGLLGSNGWEEGDRSNRNILYLHVKFCH